jgi:DNA topoisomerase I
MAKKLLIVESPAKAKTIEKYLGDEFFVKSSFGHIRDLEKGNKGVMIDNNFEPNYIISPEKTKVVKDLRDSKSKASEVWLATDEDREGEAISWHLCEVLGLDPRITKRIVFSEITKPAIQKAVLNPRMVDIDLVNAQQARRVLDRLVGFELSEVLWRKVKGKLSAGRVQSVAVRLVVDKEREITGFTVTPYFKVHAFFNVKNDRGENVILKAELVKKLDEIKDAEDFVNRCVGAKFDINNIEKKPAKRTPAAPFTTSTLQQEASRKLYYGVNRTMQIAQKLYEAGHITYMRTDSTNLSETAVAGIASEIESSFGKQYLKLRTYKSKTANAQEAHEAIRPTYMEKKNVSGDRDEQRLYELIWKRTIASQMADAELEKTIVTIGISTMKDTFLQAEGEVMKFDGFLKVYIESSDDDENNEDVKGILPPLNIGQVLDLDKLTATEKFTSPAARYTEASLVKKLEELGIGRPSTYAPTISKIMEKERGYVVKESRTGTQRTYRIIELSKDKVTHKTATENTGATSSRLYPTDIGMIVTDFLNEHFDQIMNYKFTAEVEEKLDEVSKGNVEWRNFLTDFYFPFHEGVERTVETAERAKGKRVLGTDPDSGNSVLVQITRYGPVVQIGAVEEMGEDQKPRYANLKPGQSMETISYEEAMELFKLPKSLGEYKGEEMVVSNGRYGPYIKIGDLYVNIPRGEEASEITVERAIELVEIKLDENAPIGFYNELPITKGKGRFGPFIKWNDLYINVPKRIDHDTISKEEAFTLIEAKVEKEANRYIAKWDKEKISIENGRWGPYIKFGKKMVKIPKVDGNKVEADSLINIELDVVKAWIEAELPGSFKEKPAKKVAAKKVAAKKVAGEKAPAKKVAAKKVATKKAVTKKV